MLMEKLGFEVTHCYEDLVFITHNAFLLRMEEKGEKVSLFFNSESEVGKRATIAEEIITAGREYKLNIACPGTYTMRTNEQDGTISIGFLG